MRDYEKLGLFYLGREYDLSSRTRLDDLVLYESTDLVTHAMCVGMTGSGKTGLGIALIEEAAIDGVPVIAIDPKGDLTNLLLTFPTLSADEFKPWVDPSDAATQGVSVDEYAATLASRWTSGLAEWNQDAARVQRLRDAARVAVFTPGSRAGTPLALLKSLHGGDPDDEDAAARIAGTVSSLLALVGLGNLDARSREHALVSTILTTIQPGTSADLSWLVQQIQRPSFERVGVLDLETFFPMRDRQDLALRFNSLLAAPGFGIWLDGAPLDAGQLLFTPDGKPRVAIVSIAHLDDAQRMLVVSLLLHAIVEWTRRQPGTGSLRALIYMDEVVGYLPPVANPPSKAPLLTLLKQARAFGVGVVLSTQNPVDLDYKALSNIGTWFLGKLQTERDKARVLDGLEGIAGTLDRATLDRTLSALGNRVFLMHDVHEPAPVVFETRWTLSYLRGPISREELRRLINPKTQIPNPNEVPNPKTHSPRPATGRPVVPAGITEVFLPNTGGGPLEPALYGSATVRYTDAKRGIDTTVGIHAIVPFSEGAVPVDWDAAATTDIDPERLSTSAPATASFQDLPTAALDPKRYAGWVRDFEQWIARTQALRVFTAPDLKLTSSPGESERDFRIRIQQAAREARDEAVAGLRAKYAPQLARLTTKVQQADAAIAREQQQSSQQQLQTVVSIGATLLGAFMGRKAVSASTLGRATTAARGVSRSMKEQEDVSRAEARRRDAQEALEAFQAEVEADIAAASAAADPAIEMAAIVPKRGAVDVRLLALAWR